MSLSDTTRRTNGMAFVVKCKNHNSRFEGNFDQGKI